MFFLTKSLLCKLYDLLNFNRFLIWLGLFLSVCKAQVSCFIASFLNYSPIPFVDQGETMGCLQALSKHKSGQVWNKTQPPPSSRWVATEFLLLSHTSHIL